MKKGHRLSCPFMFSFPPTSYESVRLCLIIFSPFLTGERRDVKRSAQLHLLIFNMTMTGEREREKEEGSHA